MPLKLTRRQAGAALAPALIRGSQVSRPNLLLILSDDHSNEFLGVSGNPVIQTPNLDRFASQGARCTRMFTAAPQCVPSRASLMTGRSPVAARMGRFTAPLPPDVRIFPEYLREAGYFTGTCRRNHHLDGMFNGPVSGPIYKKYGLKTMEQRMDYVDISGPGHTVARLNEFFDRKPADKPFFLWVNFNDPHHPWDSKAIPKPHDRARIPIPPYLPDLPGVREDLGRYYDEVARMDGEFQSVLDILERRGFAENTLVVFMGDNGAAIPHGKGSLYDPGLNVPCLARWPGRIRPGLVSAALLSGEDLAPTFLAAAGLKAPAGMSGRSFLGLLEGDTRPVRDYVFAARLTHGSRTVKAGINTHTFDQSRMARNSRYKLIYNCTPFMKYSPTDSYVDRGWIEMVDAHLEDRLNPALDRAYFGPRSVLELYDLDSDPAELNNLAGRPEVAQLERELRLALHEKMILDWDFMPLPIHEFVTF